MQRSESINEIAQALAKAQGHMRYAAKDSANPFFKSKYADLTSVWEACRESLSLNNIAVVQTPVATEGGVAVETMLCHASGQWMSEVLELPVAKDDAQGIGSAITYARRYALASFVGVAPEDDDGNAAAQARGNGKVQQRPANGLNKDMALSILRNAVPNGLAALEKAWKELTPEARQACKNELPQLKEMAGVKAENMEADPVGAN